MLTKPFFAAAVVVVVALSSFFATSTGAAFASNKSNTANLGAFAATYPVVVASLKLGDAEAALKEEAPPWLLASSSFSPSSLRGPRKGRRPFGYPLGVCQPGCPSPVDPCPGFFCPLWPSSEGAASNCTRVFYPGSRATRSSTNCLPDFRRDCVSAAVAADDPSGGNGITNSGCVPCALWHLVSTKCAPFSPEGDRSAANADDCAIVAAAGLAGAAPGFEANSTAIRELTTTTTGAPPPATMTEEKAPLRAAAKAAAAALAFSLGEPFAVVPSRERGSSGGTDDQPRLCLTRAQLMVVPARACSGVDDDRAECTGARAEALWEAAWLEALAAGFPPLPSLVLGGKKMATTDDDSNPKPTWAVVANPANRRSQHQTHLRVSPWSRNSQQLLYFGDVLQKWLATPAFSVDPARPTLTAPGGGGGLPLPPDPGRPGEVQSPLLATVFVPMGSSASSSMAGMEKGMGWARPWATASVVAAAVDAAAATSSSSSSAAAVVALAAKELDLSPLSLPLSRVAAPFVPGTAGGRPYGVLVAPWAQEKEAGSAGGIGGTTQTKEKKLARGFAVAAIFDIGSTQLLDEQPTGDCFPRCAQWDNPGQRAALPLEGEEGLGAKLKKKVCG